jgi:7,8-dihydropterin-6-yl-methyl-4-(beta-D-ribofuranosyl)aminobenzene 5'-phosphate synthase
MGPSALLRVLAENGVAREDLLPEHGLSVWLEVDGRRILFDTGQGPALRHNAEAIGVDLREATDVVLSHGHYDHGGGLAFVLSVNSRARVYAHPACTIRRFSRKGAGVSHAIGLAPAVVDALGPRAVWVTSPTRLSENVVVTGTIPRTWGPESGAGGLYIDSRGDCPDRVVDDQALVVTVGMERLVVAGCAHAGVVNTVRCALELAPGDGPVTVAGGMHLRDASEARIGAAVQALRGLGVSSVCPGHCTGNAAVAAFRRSWGEACRGLAAGSVHRIG